VDDRERLYDRYNEWNTHLRDVTEDATTTVRDPSEIRELQSRLDSALESLSMHDTGVVVIDSLTELGSLVQPVQAYRFLKDVRADVCKGRFVPVFAGATVMSEEVAFPHDLRYAVDGIVEMRPNEDLVEGALVKQIRVREMDGVLTYPEWTAYEYTPGKGIVTFDPIEELERSGSETAESDVSAATGDGPAGAPDTDSESDSEASATGDSAAAAAGGSESGVSERESTAGEES
jgi:KaiC/GvpD/RAD55 family RecA-like ATPase